MLICSNYREATTCIFWQSAFGLDDYMTDFQQENLYRWMAEWNRIKEKEWQNEEEAKEYLITYIDEFKKRERACVLTELTRWGALMKLDDPSGTATFIFREDTYAD